MFANTLTLTINAAPYVLNRINQDKYSSEYSLRGAASQISLKIDHLRTRAKSKSPKVATAVQYITEQPADRIRVTASVVVFATATAPEYSYSTSMLIPFIEGNDPTYTRNLALGLTGLMNSAFIDQLVQGES